MFCSVRGLRKTFQNNRDQNIDVRKRLSKTSYKGSLFTQTMRTKFMKQYQKIKQNWAGQQSFDICSIP